MDTADVPSAQWGWSKQNPRTWHVVGRFTLGFLLLMLRGNHVGHVEDWFLIGFAVLTLTVIIRDIWGRHRFARNRDYGRLVPPIAARWDG